GRSHPLTRSASRSTSEPQQFQPEDYCPGHRDVADKRTRRRLLSKRPRRHRVVYLTEKQADCPLRRARRPRRSPCYVLLGAHDPATGWEEGLVGRYSGFGLGARTFCRALVLGWALVAAPAQAATFIVNSAGDTPDANVGDGICADAGGFCTL